MMIASVWRIERSSSEATEMRNTMKSYIFFLMMFYNNVQVPVSDLLEQSTICPISWAGYWFKL